MVRRTLMWGLSSLAVLGSSAALAAGPSRYVVVFKAESLPADLAARAARAGGTLERTEPALGVAVVSGGSAVRAELEAASDVLAVGLEHFDTLPQTAEAGLESVEAAQSLDALPEVPEAGEPLPAITDGLYFALWGVRRVNAPAAWARVSPAAQSGVTVAVLDTGVIDNHPDLAGRVVNRLATNYCRETAGPAASPAYPIYRLAIDFDTGAFCAPQPTFYYNTHGTHVAGTIAASINNTGVVGVAPYANIAAYKVFDRYRTTLPNGAVRDDVGAFLSSTLAAIRDAADRGYRVVSMSLGGTYDRSDKDDNATWHAYDRAVKYAHRKGTLVVASAGNAAEGSNGRLAHLPSDLPLVLSTSASAVSSLVRDGGLNSAAPGADVLATYSNYGASTDLAAPGGDCLDGGRCQGPSAAWVQGWILSSSVFFQNGAWRLGWSWLIGTSMATPHVSGVAALIFAQHPEWGPGDVASRLKETAQQVGSRQLFGHGIVDAEAATR